MPAAASGDRIRPLLVGRRRAARRESLQSRHIGARSTKRDPAIRRWQERQTNFDMAVTFQKRSFFILKGTPGASKRHSARLPRIDAKGRFLFATCLNYPTKSAVSAMIECPRLQSFTPLIPPAEN